MDIKEELEFYKKQIVSNSEIEEVLVHSEFYFEDDIDVKNDILICGEESNYTITPFGKDYCGSVYAILDNKYVGFISTYGCCGILAKNVRDFFNFIFVLKSLQLYFYRGVFDNIDNFNNAFNSINSDITDEEHKIFEKFIQDNDFITDTSILYDRLKDALITEPTFILQADPKEYDQWDDLFSTNHKYIEELRQKNRK